MIREMECLSSRNRSKSLSNLKICEKSVGEGEGSFFCFQNKNRRVSSQLKSQSQRVFLHIVVSLWNISQQVVAVLKLRSTATRVCEWETPCGVKFQLLNSYLWLKKSSETLGLVTLFLPFFKCHPLSGYHQRKDSGREGIFGLNWYGHSDLHMEVYLMSKLAKMNSFN